MTSQWRHRNKTHSWYSELNSLQNAYFGFFIFGKLIEWRCFVTYLWNDPRTCNLVFCTLCILSATMLSMLDEMNATVKQFYLERHWTQEVQSISAAHTCHVQIIHPGRNAGGLPVESSPRWNLHRLEPSTPSATSSNTFWQVNDLKQLLITLVCKTIYESIMVLT